MGCCVARCRGRGREHQSPDPELEVKKLRTKSLRRHNADGESFPLVQPKQGSLEAIKAGFKKKTVSFDEEPSLRLISLRPSTSESYCSEAPSSTATSVSSSDDAIRSLDGNDAGWNYSSSMPLPARHPSPKPESAALTASLDTVGAVSAVGVSAAAHESTFVSAAGTANATNDFAESGSVNAAPFEASRNWPGQLPSHSGNIVSQTASSETASHDATRRPDAINTSAANTKAEGACIIASTCIESSEPEAANGCNAESRGRGGGGGDVADDDSRFCITDALETQVLKKSGTRGFEEEDVETPGLRKSVSVQLAEQVGSSCREVPGKSADATESGNLEQNTEALEQETAAARLVDTTQSEAIPECSGASSRIRMRGKRTRRIKRGQSAPEHSKTGIVQVRSARAGTSGGFLMEVGDSASPDGSGKPFHEVSSPRLLPNLPVEGAVVDPVVAPHGAPGGNTAGGSLTNAVPAALPEQPLCTSLPLRLPPPAPSGVVAALTSAPPPAGSLDESDPASGSNVARSVHFEQKLSNRSGASPARDRASTMVQFTFEHSLPRDSSAHQGRGRASTLMEVGHTTTGSSEVCERSREARQGCLQVDLTAHRPSLVPKARPRAGTHISMASSCLTAEIGVLSDCSDSSDSSSNSSDRELPDDAELGEPRDRTETGNSSILSYGHDITSVGSEMSENGCHLPKADHEYRSSPRDLAPDTE